jgi:hypothetical protein
MPRKIGEHRLSRETMQKMVQKLVLEKQFTVQYLARQIHTQPRMVEAVLSGKGEFKTKITQFALVKLYLSSVIR